VIKPEVDTEFHNLKPYDKGDVMQTIKYFLILALLDPPSLQAQQAAWELVRENFWGKIAIDPTNPDIIYVSPGNVEQWGLHKSTDGGTTWVYYAAGYEGIGAEGIVIDPNNPQRLWIYGGSFKGVARSENGGMTAIRADTGIVFDHHGYSVRAFAYDSGRHILYAGTYSAINGIYRSFDGGRRWEEVYGFAQGLAFDPVFLLLEEDSGWVYCGTAGQGIWRSKNFGVTWTLLHPAVLARQPVAFIAKVPDSRTLYAVGGLGKIFKSYDLGENWIKISTATTDSSELTGGLSISSLDTNYIYVGARAHGVVSFRGGFLMSRDGGKNWELYHKGLPQYELFRYSTQSLLQTPDSRHIYMSLFAGPQLVIFKLSQALLTSVDERSSYSPPHKFILLQNYPNPFNSQTRIDFTIASKSSVSLNVYSIFGENIVTLTQGQKEAGNHFIIWNGKNSKGGDVSSGVYIIRLQARQEVLIRKMLLIR